MQRVLPAGTIRYPVDMRGDGRVIFVRFELDTHEAFAPERGSDSRSIPLIPR